MKLTTDVYAEGLTSKTLPSLNKTGGWFFDGSDPGAALSKILSGFVALVFIFGGLWAFFMIIRGGYQIISSGGDKQLMNDGRNRITFGVMGLVVLLASIGLMILVEQLTGICLGFSCSIDLESIVPD